MNMDDDGVTDPTAEFGELFEGQTVAFENELGEHADDVLGAIGRELNLQASGHHHGTSHHPSDHEILAANLPFVPDDYLQHQQILIDSETGEFITIADVNNTVDHQNQQLNQQIFVQANQGGQMIGDGGGIAYDYNQTVETVDNSGADIAQPQAPPDPTVKIEPEEPKVKEKVKVVKDVEYFTRENMRKYLKRRGFKIDNFSPAKSISKAVLALSADSEFSNGYCKLVSFGTKYEPEIVIQEMERFWKFYLWLKSKSVVISSELLPMLVPMLLHFYFQMIRTNMLPVARKICMEFSKKFAHEDKTQEHYDILIAVMKVTSSEMLKTDAMMSSLMNKRYEFTLSELTIAYLRNFLSKSSQPALVNLFTDRFLIRARESKEVIERIDWESWMNADDTEKTAKEYGTYEKCKINSNADSFEGRYAQNIIDQLRNSVSANLPAISVYTTGDNPVCGNISKKGTLVAFGMAESGIRLFPIENARDISKAYLNPKSELEPSGIKTFSGHAGAVNDLHFHPKTKLLFSVGEDHFMRAWDLNGDNPSCRAVYRGHTASIWKLDVPDSGSLIATAGMDSTARIFMPERCDFVRLMVGHYFSVNTVKFHPNEAYIATGSVDKSVRLWSVNDGNLVRMFTGAAGSINAVAFHSSGKYIAGAGEDNKIVIWDLAEGEIIATLDASKDCKDLVFSENLLVACYRNGTLQVFNVRPLLGGYETNGTRIASPFSSKCFANTLFKVAFKDPGMLFCLGSVMSYDKSEIEEGDPLTQTIHLNNNGNGTVYESGATMLHQMLQSGSSSDMIPPSTSSDPNNILRTSRILAARLSQPLSSTGGEEDINFDEPLSVGAMASAAIANDPNLLNRSPMDAVTALNVIEQQGNPNEATTTSGSGTITMYASM